MLLKRFIIICLLLFVSSLSQAKIVFKSLREGNSSIYVMDDDGSNVQRLTFPPHYDTHPRWSPNGKQIAFMRNMTVDPKQGQRASIFIINSDGSNERRLTNDDTFEGRGSWSPDGHHFAFSSHRTGESQIYVINLLTRELRQLTRTKSLTVSPSWSPDGKYIAYRDASPNGEPTIYVMRANGDSQNPLVPGDEFFRIDPRWSPDSQSIMYVESLHGGPGFGNLVSSKVVIQEHKGGGRKVLNTPDKWKINGACWMDNGKQVLIAAIDLRDNIRQHEIYRYHLVTEKITNLTNTPQKDFAMDWISDDVLSVTPQEKKKVRWGTLKNKP